MAPLKFEESIKDKLEQRTIEPSQESWSKLELQLDEEESLKTTKKYWWLGIAASIVGFLIVTTVFMNSEEKDQVQDYKFVENNKEVFQKKEPINIVEETKPKPKLETVEIQKQTKNNIESTNIAESNAKKKDSKNKKEIIKKELIVNKVVTQKDVFETKDIVVVTVDTIKNNINVKDKTVQLDTSIINSKVESLVAKVQELEKNNRVITDEEVETLLRKAQNEITTQQILKSNTVNASALLLDVESELDESFKNRVFEALKTGFEKLKTTVAERDN
ncbi:hypothetical protein [Aquimarina sp. 2201CG14-23]|uniref:hypothetical protein n=1 Tax=Aquimarina mycalae TaxID=3040073 RepID=UPI0024782802|nr:hypothetical protein [Aquimarina sp. 2201CG14-23]MDH7445187.1 hypothetical protein [Aquimarina sp. 2201CG14-23]